MRIRHRTDKALAFEPMALGSRIGGGFIALAFFGFGISALATTVARLFDDALSDRVATTFLGLFGVLGAGIGSGFWFVILPFHLELVRDPPCLQYVWRRFVVKRRSLADCLAVVVEPGFQRSSWPYVLYVRASDKLHLVLRSEETWRSPADARDAAIPLANELASFLKCSVEFAHWPDQVR